MPELLELGVVEAQRPARAVDLDFALDAPAREQILTRLAELWERIEAEPKSSRWRRRNRLGERKRWYQEPEEV